MHEVSGIQCVHYKACQFDTEWGNNSKTNAYELSSPTINKQFESHLVWAINYLNDATLTAPIFIYKSVTRWQKKTGIQIRPLKLHNKKITESLLVI